MWATFSMSRPESVENPAESNELLRVGVLRDVLDAQLPCAQIDAHRDTSRDDHRNQPGRAQKVDAETVLDVVALELVARSRTSPR
jgi:hypothetical protein